MVAHDGVKGVQMARKERPDLIFMDIMMPAMDGHKACEMIKKSSFTWNIPVIYLTAKEGLGEEELAMDLGAKFFLRKPYRPEVLLAMVKSALKQRAKLDKGKGKILIIDKDLYSLDEIEINLKKAGYKIITSLDPEEGADKAIKEKPDIIILDGLTSKMDHYSSFMKMKTENSLRNVPIFMLTNKAESSEIMQKVINATAFVRKPINYSDLLNYIEKALESDKWPSESKPDSY